MPDLSHATLGSGTRSDRRVDLGVLGLLAFAFMLVQLATLRELRYALSTMFTLAPFLFSAVVFSIGIGALLAARLRVSGPRVLAIVLTALPLLLLPAFGWIAWLSQASMDHTADMFTRTGGAYLTALVRAFLIVAALGYGPLFALQGLVFTLYFRDGRAHGTLARVYALDLLASGLAAVLGGVLATHVTPAGSVRIAVVALVLAVTLARHRLHFSARRTAAVSLGALGIVAVDWEANVVERLERPNWLPDSLVYSTWTPYRRIDVTESKTGLTLYADGLAFQAYQKSDDRTHDNDLRVLPGLIAAGDTTIRSVLVVGSGSGADVRVLRSRIARPLEITGLELDAGFVKAAQRFPWLWESYRTAELVIEEGRFFLARSERRFDLIVYAYLDPQSAVSRLGMPDANFLYTDAGLAAAYARLNDRGHFVLNRFYLFEQDQAFFAQLCATLDAAGIPRSEVALFRSAERLAWGSFGTVTTATVVVSRQAPRVRAPSPLLEDVACEDGGRPTTDLYPFSMVMDTWFDRLGAYVRGSTPLLAGVGAAAIALLLLIATSLGRSQMFALGLASFLVESSILFSSFLLFGNPNLSAALAVGFFLTWGALGSLWSERLLTRRWFYIAVPATILVYALTAPILHARTLELETVLRAAILAMQVSACGIVVGATFPVALRAFPNHPVSTLLFFDLVGCALAPIVFWVLMFSAGMPLVTAVVTAGYGVVALTLARRL